MTLLKKVGPYRSFGATHRGGVHHDRSDCPNGQRIPSDHLASGTGDLARCELCRALDEDRAAAPSETLTRSRS